MTVDAIQRLLKIDAKCQNPKIAGGGQLSDAHG
jgi:hypothetical protein